jgi:hypothetical protein
VDRRYGANGRIAPALAEPSSMLATGFHAVVYCRLQAHIAQEGVMPKEVGRDEVQKLVAQSAQLVEVLPANEYEQNHLPGAISLPLRKLEKEARSILDPNRPVIVYCWDAA